MCDSSPVEEPSGANNFEPTPPFPSALTTTGRCRLVRFEPPSGSVHQKSSWIRIIPPSSLSVPECVLDPNQNSQGRSYSDGYHFD
uniref:Uncharacterized protein n=1 Tax=Rousettus aegyptiacus TaxID=9407 RepID=A0A7J8H1N4_ROUAE|nr:hypothetical protein HJG63_011344 [Rousettus aegyptiacus]